MNATTRFLSRAGLAGTILCGVPVVGAAHSSASAQDPSSILNGLGGNLQVALAAASEDPNGNLVFSPFSVGVALTMASAGADGDTLAQINEVLGISADPHSSMAELVGGVEEHGNGSFSVANSLWTQSGMTIGDSFNATLSDSYRAELHGVDFAADPAAAVDDVNGWVADATADRIPTLLSDDQVDELTRFILVNAVHLDATWQSPFDPENTNADEFTRGDGSVVATDFMGQTMFALYAAGDGNQAIVLPYRDGYEMVVVLPTDGGLADFEQSVADAGGNLDEVLGGFSSAEVALRLPTWDTQTSADLVPSLQSLGLTLPFDPDNADFSNITTDEPLFVSAVVHQANITVDEEGTEAAAATAVVGAAGAAPGPEPDPEVMDVDRPFFFAIRDSESGTVLFQGHINDPSA